MRLRIGWLTPLLLLGCLDAFAPAGAVPLTPPAVYRVWWTEIERCAGLSGDFDRVEWYQVPGSSYSCPAYEGQCDGWWRAPHTRCCTTCCSGVTTLPYSGRAGCKQTRRTDAADAQGITGRSNRSTCRYSTYSPLCVCASSLCMFFFIHSWPLRPPPSPH